ncbi:hypothetical protein Q3G72_013640 [Acer saccharum]|nr:hypothetical protein Q3G72_013640 [Acer saccharum]
MSALTPNSNIVYRQVYQRHNQQQLWSGGSCLLLQRSKGVDPINRNYKRIAKRDMRVEANLCVEDKEQRTVAKDGIDERCGDGDRSDDVERDVTTLTEVRRWLSLLFLSLSVATASGSDGEQQ